MSAWAWRGVLVDLTASVFLGAVFAYLAAWLYRAVQGTLFAERASIVTVNVSLALFTVAAIGLIGGDGLLGVFAAAVAFAARTDEQCTEASECFEEAVKGFFELPVLVLLGVALPWGAWSNLGWLALAYPLVAIVLRRLGGCLCGSYWRASCRHLPTRATAGSPAGSGRWASAGCSTCCWPCARPAIPRPGSTAA
ncbi:MAG: cation:proton antiporter [Pseudolabrys sp.]